MQFVHHGSAVLSPDECSHLIRLASSAPLRSGGLVGGVADERIRRAGLVWVDDLTDSDWVMDRLVSAVAAANRESFGFDLTDFAESAQIARYGFDHLGHFDWHSDIGSGALAARRKVTAVVQLSGPDDYVGGDLELRPDSNLEAARREIGGATLFPSFVLHRVTPVTAGVRWSLTLWAHGPTFR